MKFTINCIYKW